MSNTHIPILMKALTNVMKKFSFIEGSGHYRSTKFDTLQALRLLTQTLPLEYNPRLSTTSQNLLMKIDGIPVMIPNFYGQEDTWQNNTKTSIFFDALILTPDTVYIIEVLNWIPEIKETITWKFNVEDFEHNIARKRGFYIRKDRVKIRIHDNYEYIFRKGLPDEANF